jgi:maltose alpha-D-glucosyltransferase/alpha-amylase
MPKGVLGMQYDWNGRCTIVLHNFCETPCAVRLHVQKPDGKRLTNLLSQDVSDADDRGGHQIELEPYGYRWLRVGDLEKPIRDEKARRA